MILKLKSDVVTVGEKTYRFPTINDAHAYFVSQAKKIAGEPEKRAVALGGDFATVVFAKHVARFSDPVAAELLEE